MIVIRDAFNLKGHIQGYKEEVLKNSFVQSGTVSGYLPVSGTSRGNDTFWPEGADQTNLNTAVSLMVWNVDDDYTKTLGLTSHRVAISITCKHQTPVRLSLTRRQSVFSASTATRSEKE
ncbi:MAG: hypothetical protein WDO15_13935 [Bacteroidota bacterium]